jgi:hypothetical protein
LEFSTNIVPSFDSNEWGLKNGLHSGGLNPGPLGDESSALTTRTLLLTNLSLEKSRFQATPLQANFLFCYKLIRSPHFYQEINSEYFRKVSFENQLSL